jgi:alpha-D-ribose 1-methylphosphonate 5-triphosphate synthase subunit PhnH
MPKPAPLVIMGALAQTSPWSIQTIDDYRVRLETAMPGIHDYNTIAIQHSFIPLKRRKELVRLSVFPRMLDFLVNAIDFSQCRVILDPWADLKHISKYAKEKKLPLITNDVFGKSNTNLSMEPLEANLYTKVKNALGTLDAIITSPPHDFLDMAVLNAVEFTGKVACIHVPTLYFHQKHDARKAYIQALADEHRAVVLMDMNHDTACWLCIFASKQHRQRMLAPGYDSGLDRILVKYMSQLGNRS